MKYLLYSLDRSEIGETAAPLISGRLIRYSPFNPRWAISAFRVGGSEYFKVLVMATWSLLTRAAIPKEISVWAYIGANEKMLHYSVVTPTKMHMPWLSQDESGIEIGGCVTIASARGMRIYPYVLAEVAKDADADTPIYMIVDKDNRASRAGMDRAGMQVTVELQKRRRNLGPPVYELLANAVTGKDGEWTNKK